MAENFNEKTVNPDLETRGELLRRAKRIQRYFKVLMFLHIGLLLITISRMAMGALISIRYPEMLPPAQEAIAAVLFAILAVAAGYKKPFISAVTAAIWLAFPRFGTWELVLRGGGYLALYIIFNISMAVAYGIGIFLSREWKRLRAMPDFPSFSDHPDGYEEVSRQAVQKEDFCQGDPMKAPAETATEKLGEQESWEMEGICLADDKSLERKKNGQ